MKTTCVFLICGVLSIAVKAEPLSLERAVERALQNDAWLESSELREDALDAQSIAVGELPDPIVSIGLRNLPVDSFSLGQEPMTQVTLGVAQTFPRGDSRQLRREKLTQLSQIEPALRQDRIFRIERTVSEIWLDAYLANQAASLIEADRSLFEHLVDVAESAYSTALGGTRQHDVIRAQLELTRLEERIISLREQYAAHLGRLSQWIGFEETSATLSFTPGEFPAAIPAIATDAIVAYLDDEINELTISSRLIRHPTVVAVDKKIQSSETDISLAKQSYKPQWGVSASYGYRDDDRVDRDDFLSVGVTFDLPLFTAKRQDQYLRSATSESEALKLKRILLLRSLRASYESSRGEYLRLIDRRSLYSNRLLKEMEEQAEASLQAYTNDDGDFAEVVRARIADLNARVDVLRIDVSLAKLEAQLNYLLAAETGGLSE